MARFLPIALACLIGLSLVCLPSCTESICWWTYEDGCTSVTLRPSRIVGTQDVWLTLSIDGDVFNTALFARSSVNVRVGPLSSEPDSQPNGSPPLKLEYPPQLTLGKRNDYRLLLRTEQIRNLPPGQYDIVVSAGDYTHKSNVPLDTTYYPVAAPLFKYLPNATISIGYISSAKQLFSLQRKDGNSLVAYSMTASLPDFQITAMIPERQLSGVYTNECAAASNRDAYFLYCAPISAPGDGYLLKTSLSQGARDIQVTQLAKPPFMDKGVPSIVAEESRDSFLLATPPYWSIRDSESKNFLPVSGLTLRAPEAALSGDINGDEKSEYLLWSGGIFTILSPNETGLVVDAKQSTALNLVWPAQGSASGAFAMGDLFGAGYPQLVAMSRDADRLLILSPPRGSEGWVVTEAVLPTMGKIDLGGDEVISLQVADINGDGVNELLMGTGRNTSPRPSITRLWLLRAGKVGME